MSSTGRVVLVTGGTGLVGKAIQEALQELKDTNANDKFIFLSSKDVDLRDLKAVREYFNQHRPTHVIHLAAMVGGLYHNMRHNLEFLRNNILINDNVLQTSFDLKVKKVISCLSTCIFPDKTSFPIDETMVHNGPPHPSNFGYSYAKRLIDIQNRAYHEKNCETVFTSVIPCNVFGPWDNYNLEDSHVIPGLIHKLFLANKNGQEGIIFGTGTPLRQFIYSLDLARLILWVLDEYNDVDPIILSVDEKDEVQIKDVAELIAKNLNFQQPLKYDTTKADGQYKKTASNAKLRRLHPTFQFTSLEIAMEKSVKWFVDNFEIARK